MTMNFRKSTVFAAAACGLIAAAPARAQDLPRARVAVKQLYKTGKKATEVKILRPDLIPAPLLPAIKRAATIQKYYEAMAASPSEGLQSGSAFQAINHHTAAAADAAAIAGCNAKKKKGSDDCVVVAEFLPKGYAGPRAISLSMNATKVFAGKYRRAFRNKAFAISPSSGEWGWVKRAKTLDQAKSGALAACAQKAAAKGANDCRLISAN